MICITKAREKMKKLQAVLQVVNTSGSGETGKNQFGNIPTKKNGKI